MSDAELPQSEDVAALPQKTLGHESAPRKKRRRAFAAFADDVEYPTEEWMLSYSDMVTLLLTMFVALLLNADFTDTARGGNQAGGGEAEAAAGGGGSGAGVGDAGKGKGGSAGRGLKDALQGWFNLNVSSPYTDEKGYVLVMPGPENTKALPQNSELAVIKGQDLAQIAFREKTLASIRQKLVAARIDQYVTADIEGDGIRLNIPNAILFALGSAEFASEGAGVIRAIVPIVSGDTFTISVEGHTDNAPIKTDRFPSNWELSAQRAAAVVRVMLDAGIAAKRLEAVGLADTQPLSTNDSAEGRAQNRRVAIFLRL